MASLTVTVLQGVDDGGLLSPTDNASWSDLGSSPYAAWSNWTTWHPEPNTIQVRLTADRETVDFRTPLVAFESQGEVTVQLKISTTGAFAGEETTVNIVEGTEYTYVQGRYYRWTVTVSTDSNLTIPLLTTPVLDFDTSERQEIFKELNTATLTGTIDARQISTTIGLAHTLIATGKQEGVTYSSGTLRDRVYAIPDDYVFQENAIITNIVSKSPPTIRCFDLNGESIDAVVDVLVIGLPKIYLTPTGIRAI